MVPSFHRHSFEEIICSIDGYPFPIHKGFPTREISVTKNEKTRGGCFYIHLHLSCFILDDLNSFLYGLFLLRWGKGC
jgi:hypothetical protein